NLTLEMFAEPFVSSGRYGPLKELAAPRSFDFLVYGRDTGVTSPRPDGYHRIDPDGPGPAAPFHIDDPVYNDLSLLGTAGPRGERSAGSTLFLARQQSRTERLTNHLLSEPSLAPHFDFEKDARALLDITPENTYLAKVSYWFNP